MRRQKPARRAFHICRLLVDIFYMFLYNSIMQYYKRHLATEIQRQFSAREIIVLTGMRRVGKTTLARMLYEKIESDNKVFLDLENPIEQKIFEEKDFNNIWGNLRHYGVVPDRKAYIFLDELQAQPDVVRALKYLYDHYDVKFFVTGSSSFYLKNLFPESLSGRKIVFELYPLDFEEFLIFKGQKREFQSEFSKKDSLKNRVSCEKVKTLYEEYLEFGGFPQVVLAKDVLQKKFYITDIFKSYFEKEVRALADFRRLNLFRDLLLLLMQRIGGKLEISRLASEVGASRDTIYSYLSFLEGTYFAHFLSPYSKSVDREVSGSRKVYLCDNGIASQLSRVGEGSLFENAVFLNVRKHGEVRYYQRRTGAEIDFILPDKGIAIEVKQKGTIPDYKKLASTSKSIGMKEHYVVTRDFKDLPGFIPACEL